MEFTLEQLKEFLDIDAIYQTANPDGQTDILTADGEKRIDACLKSVTEYVNSQIVIDNAFSYTAKDIIASMLTYRLHEIKGSLNPQIESGYDRAKKKLKDLYDKQRIVNGLKGTTPRQVLFNQRSI